jgi:hypothetical protein
VSRLESEMSRRRLIWASTDREKRLKARCDLVRRLLVGSPWSAATALLRARKTLNDEKFHFLELRFRERQFGSQKSRSDFLSAVSQLLDLLGEKELARRVTSLWRWRGRFYLWAAEGEPFPLSIDRDRLNESLVLRVREAFRLAEDNNDPKWIDALDRISDDEDCIQELGNLLARKRNLKRALVFCRLGAGGTDLPLQKQERPAWKRSKSPE